jgi:protein-disulfide isomerase
MKEYFLPVSILIAGFLVSGTLLYTSVGDSTNAVESERASNTQEQQEGGSEDLVPKVTEDDHVRGASAEEAAFTVIEYLDYQCHFCGEFHPTMERVVSENDDIRWVARDFAVFGLEPSVASECVARLAGEDEFWNFGDKLFENQDRIGRESFEELATDYGIGEEEFSQCLNSDEVREEVSAESRQARDAGAQGTPFSVIVNDETGQMFSISGAVPYERLMSQIERARNAE